MANTDAQASFAINLEDGTSGAAESAAGALKRLRDEIQGDQRELKALQQAMKNLQGGTSVNVEQFRQLQTQINAKKQAIANAQSSFLSLGGTFKAAAAGGRTAQSRFAELAATARGMPGPLGALAGNLDALRGALAGGAIAAGIGAIVAALALLVGASLAAAAALAKYGIAQADARRSELLRLEGLTKLRNWYGIAAGNAGELQRAIDRVSGSTALGRDKVAGYAEMLYRMHLRGDNLAAALEGVAIKAAVQGDAQAKMFAGWAAGAALTGRSVRALSDDVKARLGGIAAQQMLSLDVQAQKMRESFDALFTGLKIERLLEGLNSITSLLSQSTATGRALKAMLEVALQPLIDSAADGAPVMKRFFQGMTIAALQIGIAFLQVRNWFKRTFGASDMLKDLDATTLALKAGVIAVGLFVAGLAVVAAAVAGIASAIAAPFVLAGAAVYALVAAGKALVQTFVKTDWGKLGRAIIEGILGALVPGGPRMVAVIKGLGAGAIKAFKQSLGISSPSKVFFEAGMTLPKGAELGVQRQAPSLRKTIETMVRPPRIGRAAVDLTGGAARMGGSEGAAALEQPARSALERGGDTNVAVSVGEIHVHTTSDKPRDLALEVKRELEQLLEGIAIQVGAGVPGAP